MVKKTTFRRRVSSKRFRLKKGTRAIAKRAERTVKTLARTREIKYYNKAISSAPFAVAGVVIPLLDVDQGDTSSTRDGAMLTARSIKMLGNFSSGASTTLAPLNARVIIFQDKQQVADTAPAVTDILLTASVISNYNYPLVQKRFKIMYDRQFNMGPGSTYVPVAAGAGTGTSVVNLMSFKRWIFPTAKNILFNGVTGTDINKNGIYILLIGSNTDYDYVINSQLSFTDS